MGEFQDETDRLIVVIDDLVCGVDETSTDAFTKFVRDDSGLIIVVFAAVTRSDEDHRDALRTWPHGVQQEQRLAPLWTAKTLAGTSDPSVDHVLFCSSASAWGSRVPSNEVVDLVRTICRSAASVAHLDIVKDHEFLGGMVRERSDSRHEVDARMSIPVVRHAIDLGEDLVVTERVTIRSLDSSTRPQIVPRIPSVGAGGPSELGVDSGMPMVGGKVAKTQVAETPLVETEVDTAKRDLRRARAQRELGEIDTRRAIWNASGKKLSQRQIADQLSRSQPDVGRTLKKVERNPELLAVRPRELALRRAVGQMSTEELMARLATFPYTDGQADPSSVGGGYLPGTWDDVRALRREDLITSAEWEELFEKRFGPAETSVELLLPADINAREGEPPTPEEIP